jgi:hypothetical protein
MIEWDILDFILYKILFLFLIYFIFYLKSLTRDVYFLNLFILKWLKLELIA